MEFISVCKYFQFGWGWCGLFTDIIDTYGEQPLLLFVLSWSVRFGFCSPEDLIGFLHLDNHLYGFIWVAQVHFVFLPMCCFSQKVYHPVLWSFSHITLFYRIICRWPVVHHCGNFHLSFASCSWWSGWLGGGVDTKHSSAGIVTLTSADMSQKWCNVSRFCQDAHFKTSYVSLPLVRLYLQ